MKKTKIMPLLLGLALLASLALPAVPARAAENGGSDSSNGVHFDKTATRNDDGTYTITLEAYATGEKVISEVTKDIPTDIILVLDQSGSMAKDIGTVSFKKYEDETNRWGTTYHTRNQDYYDYRHNGGSSNLWHKLDDDSYVSVSVTKQEQMKYTELGKLVNYDTNWPSLKSSCYFYYANNLYEKIGDAYSKVELSRSGDWWDGYVYTYTFSDGTTVTSSGDDTKPDFGSHAPLYSGAVDDSQTVYTYTYTDSNNNVQTIGTSTGADTVFSPTLYERSTSTNGGGSRLDALKASAVGFANAVAEKAKGKDGEYGTDDDVNHRIAVVGYADTDSSYGYNTGVFIGGTLNRYETDAFSVYSKAFQDMNTSAGKDNVTASFDALQASGATRIDYGLTMAEGILDANPIPEGKTRSRVVIVFTDGSPTSSNGFETSVASSAITTANDIKTGGTTVYTIGIFSGADATSAGTEPTRDLGQNSSSMAAACNWFMQQVSSNNGTPRSPSYYLSAADSSALNNIFQQISDNIETGGTTSKLTEKAVIRDIVSPYFVLPANVTADDITLETYRYIGASFEDPNAWVENDSAMGATATLDTVPDAETGVDQNRVNVTGFNFSENWCGTETNASGVTTYRGNKLVISFKVEPREGFLGGNDVVTNNGAGIYEDDKSEDPIGKVDDPTVDVSVKGLGLTPVDMNVYLGAQAGGTVTKDEILKNTTFEFNGTKLDLTNKDGSWGLDSWKDDYVDITVTVKDKDGNEVDSFKDLKDDVDYTVTVTVKPKDKDESEGVSASKPGTIHVFKPELTYADQEVYYGADAPQEFTPGVKWVHVDGNNKKYSTDKGVTMIGDAPALDLTYGFQNGVTDGKINTKQDIGVTVTVKIGNTDVTRMTTFLHTNCDGKTCTLPDGARFLLHVKTCTLTISKTGGAADESYVFDVYKDGEKYSEVTVWGNGTETLVELPVGTYTIEENTGWSWRYTANNGGSAELTAQNPTGTITCTNTKGNDKWLNGFSEVVRNVVGNS